MSRTQPNFLIIMTDQLAAPALPSYGHSVVKAPHITRLSEGGVQFNNAYCNSPLCAPSRASMLTGQLPSLIGAYDNAASFPNDIPTLAHFMRAGGYAACLCGKMHLIGADQLRGFEQRLTTDIYPADFGWTPDWTDDGQRPSWYHNMLSVAQAGICKSSNQFDYDETVAFHAVRKLYDLARSEDESPFLLLVSFTHPHDPFAITQPYWDRYREDSIDMPSVPQLPFQSLDHHSQRLFHVCDMGRYALTEGRVRRARHAYYGMISYIDDKVGQLVEALNDTHLADDTIVIFLSDHGEMLGERGMWYKMSFFEWSARVPLIFHAPARFSPRRISQPVSLLDLLPTLMSLSGDSEALQAYAHDGHDLLPWLVGDAGQRHAVYGEYLAEGAIAPVMMIRRDRYKYIFSSADPEQLYDLTTDPLELNNLAELQASQTLIQHFRSELAQQWDVDSIHRRVLSSQRRRRLVDRALRQGNYHSWDFQPLSDASEQYMRNHLDLNVLERSARYPMPEKPPPDGAGV